MLGGGDLQKKSWFVKIRAQSVAIFIFFINFIESQILNLRDSPLDCKTLLNTYSPLDSET